MASDTRQPSPGEARKARTSGVIRELQLLQLGLERGELKEPYRIKRQAADAWFSALILANALFVGLDLEFTPEFNWTSWIAKAAFTLIFSIELTLRIVADRSRFFDRIGAADLVSNSVGMLDSWALTPLAVTAGRDPPTFLRYLSVVRLLRLFRLVELISHFQAFRDLMVIIRTMRNSVKAVFWMSLLLGMLLYMGSVCTLLLLGLPNRDSDADVDAFYGSMGKALFSHFMAISLERWPEVALASMRHSKAWGAYWSAMIAFGNCVLVNVIVGIIVEQVLRISLERDRRRSNFQAAKESLRDTIHVLFDSYDLDASGLLEREEFRTLLDNRHMKEIMQVFGINLNTPENMLHTIMDLNGDGAISFEDFFSSIMRLSGSTENLQTVFVQHEVCSCHTELAHELDSLVGQLEEAEVAEEVTVLREIRQLQERVERFARQQGTLCMELQALRRCRDREALLSAGPLDMVSRRLSRGGSGARAKSAVVARVAMPSTGSADNPPRSRSVSDKMFRASSSFMDSIGRGVGHAQELRAKLGGKQSDSLGKVTRRQLELEWTERKVQQEQTRL